jgi:hypothetical protein
MNFHFLQPPLALVPAWTTICGSAIGASPGSIAVCAELGLVVFSDKRMNTISMFSVRTHDKLSLLGTLGGRHTPCPLQFAFSSNDADKQRPGGGGMMAFTGSALQHVLVVTDVEDKVHVIDVVHGRHLGFVLPHDRPLPIPSPCAVAATGDLVAVSAGRPDCASRALYSTCVGFTIQLVRGTLTTSTSIFAGIRWHFLREILVEGGIPRSFLKVSDDGARLLAQISPRFGLPQWTCQEIAVKDGSCLSRIHEEWWMYADALVDVVWDGHEWLLLAFLQNFGFSEDWALLPTKPRSRLDNLFIASLKEGEPVALACLPGFGFVVLAKQHDHEDHSDACLRFYGFPNVVAMLCMSDIRVAWLSAVIRGLFKI